MSVCGITTVVRTDRTLCNLCSGGKEEDGEDDADAAADAANDEKESIGQKDY